MGILNLLFDKLTKSLEDVSTGESFTTDVVAIAKKDLPAITKSKGYLFVWLKEFNSTTKSVYKLVLTIEPTTIQGLVSIEDAESFIEMHLVESAPHNFGKHKKYYGVLANLVAFACKISFEKGYNGEIAFTAKTSLVTHYQKSLGAISIGKQKMYIPTTKAKDLVSLYYPKYL